MNQTEARHDSKTKFLDAALYVIRAKGYSATRIEDICEAAGLTKGSFFHHFKSKEELAIEAAAYFSSMADTIFASAPYRNLPDPLDRLFGYVDFRKAILMGELPQFTCLLGTMLQEVYETHPLIREACDRYIRSHAAKVEADITEAMARYGPRAEWTASSLALYTQAVIQGAFILAKAHHSAEVAAPNLDHLRRYLQLLFTQPQPQSQSEPEPELQLA